jgi:putative intracellular protease/amidase
MYKYNQEVVMKKIALLLMLVIILPSFKIANQKVLLYIQDNSMDLNFMLTNEAGMMKQMLEQAGFDVDIATLSGEILKSESLTLKPDFKLSKVNIRNYAGFILPCMAANDSIVTQQEQSFVREIVKEGKPLAAQTSAVLILAKAGVLNGKKFGLEENLISLAPEFKNAIYSGTGVVQDGNIITSGTCPMMAKMTGKKDGTTELTNKLIETIKARTNLKGN